MNYKWRYWVTCLAGLLILVASDSLKLIGEINGAIFSLVLAGAFYSGVLAGRKDYSWRRITPESLPKVGDEVGAWIPSMSSDRPWIWSEISVIGAVASSTAEEWASWGWTHFRPINPPKKESK